MTEAPDPVTALPDPLTVPAWQTYCALLVFQHAPNRLGHTRHSREIR